MRLDWWTIALQIVNFAILVWLLRRFLFRPVLAVLEARKAEAARRMTAAAAAEAEAKERTAALDAARTGIAKERDDALAAAAKEAQKMAETRRAEADRDAKALADAARRSLAAERATVLAEAQRVALDLGAAFAQRLLAEVPIQHRADVWLKRIEDHLAQLPDAERAALAAQIRAGARLKVVTADTLPAPTIEEWRHRLGTRLGAAPADFTVDFEVDPDLIAGVEAHFPTAVARFSWRTIMAQMQKETDAHAAAD